MANKKNPDEKTDADAAVLTTENPLALPDQFLPEQLHIIATDTRPLFPGQVQLLIIPQDPWGETLQRIAKTPQRVLGWCYVADAEPEKARSEDFPAVGCAVRLHNFQTLEGKIQCAAQGLKRFRIASWMSEKKPFLAQVHYPTTPQPPRNTELQAYSRTILQLLRELAQISPLHNEELRRHLEQLRLGSPELLADFAATLSSTDGAKLQEILETLPLVRRMEKVLPLLNEELQINRLQKEITTQVNKKIETQQREFFLREQLKAIQKELGLRKDDRTVVQEKFNTRAAKLKLPPEARERYQEELDKLAVLEPGAAEDAMTRTYLDWLTSIPWGVFTGKPIKTARARKLLNEHHYGLQEVKQRIIEFLAVEAFKEETRGSILLLVGPPGVGKTSIGRSIATALERHFYRFSLGGITDEAEIKGHRRTYIGAMPGKFLQALKAAGSADPVIMLDEMDKIGTSYRGDPAAALLEVLDPEQNASFLDHYLDLRVDLSRVLFIGTANQDATVPAPLRDRMEVIRLPGYLADEKVAIAQQHLWPRLLQRHGVPPKRLSITTAAMGHVVQHYTREVGVRGLEKQLACIVRKNVLSMLDKPRFKKRVGIRQLKDYLEHPSRPRHANLRGVGISMGMAWTPLGGAILCIEIVRVHNSGRELRITGNLGSVMRESVEIAYSHVRGNHRIYGFPAEYFHKAGLHLHVPEGAVPKDGPSAGITIAAALVSLARRQAPAALTAMSGELTLTGAVLGVGGIREKLIAARQTKLKAAIFPESNRADVEVLPPSLYEGIKIHFLRRCTEIPPLLFAAKKPPRSSSR